MPVIDIISREIIGDFFVFPPPNWIFHISESDYNLINANHELLQIETSYAGWVKPWISGGDPNTSIYGISTVDPFQTGWYTNYSTDSIPTGDWTIGFIQIAQNPFFDDGIDSWTSFTTGTIPIVVPPVIPASTIEPILLEWSGASDSDGTVEGYQLSYKTTGPSFINIATVQADANDPSHGSYSYTPIQQIAHTFRIIAVDNLGAVSVPKYYQHQIVANYQISNLFDTQTTTSACQITQVGGTYSSVFLSTTPIAVGVIVFINAEKTIRFTGSNNCWIIKTPGGLEYSCRINGSGGSTGGEIIELYLCSGGGGVGDNSGLITLGRSSIQGVNGVCSLGWDVTKYWQDTLAIDTIIYNDSDYTSFFIGNLKYYIIQYFNQFDLTVENVVQIDNLGRITYINNRINACSSIKTARRSFAPGIFPGNDSCTLSTVGCYIRTVDAYIINNGDIVYNDINGASAFNGGDQYYRLYLNSNLAVTSVVDLTNAIAKVGINGLVTISGYCGLSTEGGCPVPETLILLANGKQIPAGDVMVGDKVFTLHEITFELGEYEVKEKEILYQDRLQITFEDESIIKVSDTHKFLMIDKSWKSSYKLENGDIIKGLDIDKKIISIEKIGIGEVVRFNIIDAHTYISEGLISHNKGIDDYNTYTPIFTNNP